MRAVHARLSVDGASSVCVRADPIMPTTQKHGRVLGSQPPNFSPEVLRPSPGSIYTPPIQAAFVGAATQLAARSGWPCCQGGATHPLAEANTGPDPLPKGHPGDL